MKISVFGLGYVGCVSAACLVNDGHYVYGVDIDKTKLNFLRKLKSPVIEPGLTEFLERVFQNGDFLCGKNAEDAILKTDLSLVCVGTPSNSNGDLNLEAIQRICMDIGRSLRHKESLHNIIIRSTIFPGTVEKVIIPLLEEYSGKRLFESFKVSYNPEFLREGSSVQDYYNPPFILIGELKRGDGKAIKEIYKKIKAPVITTSVKVAEMVKYVNNAFHALKIGFANEIGNLCKALDIDGHEVMNIFCLDKKLNISTKYFRPGFAFGGSCLPKDLRVILYKAKGLDLLLPILNSILPSNEIQIKKTIDMVLRTKLRKVAILGLSFKEGTDDLRESPMVSLAEALLGKGIQVKIHDSNVSISRLFGANRKYIKEQIPHIANLMCKSASDAIESSDVIIIAHKNKKYLDLLAKFSKKHTVIDLVKLIENPHSLKASYHGICW